MSTANIPLKLLDTVRIASPCPMRWKDMKPGDESDHVRHCSQCNLSVYNFSNMTAEAAEAVLRSKGEGRLCAGWYRRADGTMITRDCPVGLRAVRIRLARISLRVAALLALVLTGGYLVRAGQTDPNAGSTGGIAGTAPFERACAFLRSHLPFTSQAPQGQVFIAGDICIPTPRPPSSTTSPILPNAPAN